MFMQTDSISPAASAKEAPEAVGAGMVVARLEQPRELAGWLRTRGKDMRAPFHFICWSRVPPLKKE